MLLLLLPSASWAETRHDGASDQLNELIISARALASADDTYEYVSRPNLPYVSAHYAPEKLAAERIDTVLIINSHGTPLFWRRLNQGHNRGFPDARAFLAELPSLPAPGAAGIPGIAKPLILANGPALVAALPIYRANGRGNARGWLIAARTVDTIQWRQLSAIAKVSDRAPDSAAASLAGRGAVVPLTAAGATSAARSALWFTASIIILGVLTFKSKVLTAWSEKAAGSRVIARLTGASMQRGGAARRKTLPTSSASRERPAVPVGSDALQIRLAAANAVFRYQPQIDLRTGRVAGVEALLCVPGSPDDRPAIQLLAEIEEAGLKWEIFERRLQEACRAQRTWLRKVGHDFAIGVPVAQNLLADPALLPLVNRILAEHALEPSLLELQVEETAIGACSATLCTLAKVHEAGISIALDGFNASHSNLRLLTILPISKLRIDPWLLLRMGDRIPEALLFDGILGAARSLGIAVCATGVATPELLTAVLKHGRPLAQGAAVGSPLADLDFLELLRGDDEDTETLRTLSDEALLA
ncbi:MAG TPA: EAL domain-containing protein [Steroidobacteraceae bacterium]|nr:EAL domain-containing protein [Steroidobacteraceae bacterium]